MLSRFAQVAADGTYTLNLPVRPPHHTAPIRSCRPFIVAPLRS